MRRPLKKMRPHHGGNRLTAVLEQIGPPMPARRRPRCRQPFIRDRRRVARIVHPNAFPLKLCRLNRRLLQRFGEITPPKSRKDPKSATPEADATMLDGLRELPQAHVIPSITRINRNP